MTDKEICGCWPGIGSHSASPRQFSRLIEQRRVVVPASVKWGALHVRHL